VTSAPVLLATRLTQLDRPEDRPELERLILEAMADLSGSVREVAVAWAARVLEPEMLVPLVAEGVDALLRNAALAALERQGPYARAAVERAVGSPDNDLAMFSCQVLGSIGAASSVPALLTALQQEDVNLIQAAAEALGRLAQREAVPALIGLLGREPWLQLAAADALGAIGDPRAAEPLLALVPDSMIAEPALNALALLAPPVVLPRLLTLLVEPGNRRLRGPLLRAVGAILGPPVSGAAERDRPEGDGLEVMGRLIEADHSDAGLWQYLAERLGSAEEETPAPAPGGRDDRGHARAAGATLRAAGALVVAAGITSLLPLVLRWAEPRESREWVESLIRRYLLRLIPMTRSLLTHPDPAVRAGTLWVIPPSTIGADHLHIALDDPAPSVRTAACHGIGILGDSTAALRLASLLDTGTVPEQSAAASALVLLPQEVQQPILFPRLESTIDDSVLVAVLGALSGVHSPALEDRVLQLAGRVGGSIRRSALRAVARIPGPRAEVLLLRALADRDPGLQVEALDLLVMRGGDTVRTTLLAMLGVGDSLRYHVIRALGRLGRSEAVGPLVSLFPLAALHERIEILTALARLGGERAGEFLRQCLDQSQPEIRRVAAQGLAALAGADDLELLGRLARDSDWVVRSEAAQALGRFGPGPAHPVLLDLARDLEPAVARTARAALAKR
jgi:HEAT repeat protein